MATHQHDQLGKIITSLFLAEQPAHLLPHLLDEVLELHGVVHDALHRWLVPAAELH